MHLLCLSTIQSPKLEIKILSKAVIARLIPLDTASDEHAVLIMLTDEDAIGAIEILKMITSLNATMNFPCIHMLMACGLPTGGGGGEERVGWFGREEPICTHL